MSGRPRAQLALSESEREQLVALIMRRKTAQGLALRASIVLACADSADNKAVAVRQRVTPQTVSKWRARFVEHRLDAWSSTSDGLLALEEMPRYHHCRVRMMLLFRHHR
jgi:Homeodomain-like domain